MSVSDSVSNSLFTDTEKGIRSSSLWRTLKMSRNVTEQEVGNGEEDNDEESRDKSLRLTIDHGQFITALYPPCLVEINRG